jgi:hypothetical protein
MPTASCWRVARFGASPEAPADRRRGRGGELPGPRRAETRQPAATTTTGPAATTTTTIGPAATNTIIWG